MKRLRRILYLGIGLALACAIKVPYCFIPSSLFHLTQITNITRATLSLSLSLKRCHWRKKSLYAPWEQKLSVHPLKPSLNRNIPANPDAHEFGTGHEIIEAIVPPVPGPAKKASTLPDEGCEEVEGVLARNDPVTLNP